MDEPKEFSCDLCADKFPTKNELRDHTLLLHMGTYELLCLECGFSEEDDEVFRNHMASHEMFDLNGDMKPSLCNYMCTLCGFKTLTKDEILNHNLLIHGSEHLKCNFCNFKTDVPKKLQIHTRKHESKAIEVFACDQCDFRTNKKNSIKSHELTHTQIKRYQCDMCSYSAIRSDYLKKHLATHKKHIRPYECPMCDYTAVRKDYVKKHVFKHLQKSMLQCDKCNRWFRSETKLQAHKKRNDSCNLDNYLKCEFCSYTCNNPQQMASHMPIHDVSMECATCKNTYDLSEISAHLEYCKAKTNIELVNLDVEDSLPEVAITLHEDDLSKRKKLSDFILTVNY